MVGQNRFYRNFLTGNDEEMPEWTRDNYNRFLMWYNYYLDSVDAIRREIGRSHEDKRVQRYWDEFNEVHVYLGTHFKPDDPITLCGFVCDTTEIEEIPSYALWDNDFIDKRNQELAERKRLQEEAEAERKRKAHEESREYRRLLYKSLKKEFGDE